MTYSGGHFEEMQNKNLGGFIPLIHLLWYLDKYVCILWTVDMLIQWLLWMTRLPWPQRLQWRTSRGGLKWRFWLCQRSTKRTLRMPLVMLCSMPSSCGTCWKLIRRSKEQQLQLRIPKKSGFCVAFHCGFWTAAEGSKGTRKCMLQKPSKNRS